MAARLTLRMKKITIVDDDKDLRSLLEVVLKFNQFTVQIFSSAEDFLKGYDAHTTLFIIDINLGGLSGLQLCEHLKADPDTKFKPIVIISAHPDLEALGRKACADAILQKPFSQAVLVQKITELLG